MHIQSKSDSAYLKAEYCKNNTSGSLLLVFRDLIKADFIIHFKIYFYFISKELGVNKISASAYGLSFPAYT